MVSDRIGDFIVRLQNAVMISKQEVRVPHSNHLEAIARKLKDLGFLTSVEVRAKEEGSTIKTLIVGLAYNERGEARLNGVKRVSKPGRRLYAGVADAHRVRHGRGARLLSTSAGVLSDAEARKQKVGGEELFEIW
jgi:small subunit ribosomal protein S8